MSNTSPIEVTRPDTTAELPVVPRGGASSARRSQQRRSRRGQSRRRRRWLRWFATAYAVVVGALLLAWGVAGDAWWLQPFNLSTFWWLVVSWPLVVVAAVARRWDVLVRLALPALAWVWIYGTAFVPTGPSAVPDDAVEVTVVSYNTWVQASGVDHVVRQVDAADADVLLAMEVFPQREQELQAALADTLPHTAVLQSEGVGGVMVLSAHPIVDMHEVPAVEGARRTFVAVIEVDGQRVQVVPLHLRSPCLECGDSIVDRLTLEGSSRAREVNAVLDVIDDQLPVVVGGDLNSTERSMAYRTLAGAGFSDAQREAGEGLGLTWPTNRRVPAFVRIDWILSRGLQPVQAWVPAADGSDHRAVVARLALPPQEQS